MVNERSINGMFSIAMLKPGGYQPTSGYNCIIKTKTYVIQQRLGCWTIIWENEIENLRPSEQLVKPTNREMNGDTLIHLLSLGLLIYISRCNAKW